MGSTCFPFRMLCHLVNLLRCSEQLAAHADLSALDCLFDTLKTHGKSFTPSFWSLVCSQILFPIFGILRASSDTRFKSSEDMSVWLSTTLISALRDMIDLYTFYFGVMQLYLDGLLDILVACICQGECWISEPDCLYLPMSSIEISPFCPLHTLSDQPSCSQIPYPFGH